MLQVKLPVMTTDETNRYSKQEADQSRLEVTSIRHIVENIHAHQKKYQIQKHPVDLQYLKRHFTKYYRFVNSLINRFGFTTRGNPQGSNNPSNAFNHRNPNRFLQLINNPCIIDSNLSTVMFDKDHDVYWARRRKNLWREKVYNDPELLALFPRLSENDMRNLTGGSYHLKTAHGYVTIQLDYYKKRHEQLDNASQGSTGSETTYNTNTLNQAYTFKVEVLSDESRRRHFPQFNSILRTDMSSYFSKWKRFKTIVGIRRGVPSQFTFGCTCSTGQRTNPCVHNIIFLRMFSHTVPMQHQ